MNLYVKLEEGSATGLCIIEDNIKNLFPGSKLSDEYLAQIGYARVFDSLRPENLDLTKDFVEVTPEADEDGIYYRTFVLQDKEDITDDIIAAEKTRVLKEKIALVNQRHHNASKRPIVDTGLGFSVQGGAEDLASFKVGKDQGLLTVRDVDNVNHTLSSIDDYDDIISAIEAENVRLLQAKWDFKAALEAIDTTQSLSDYKAAVEAIDIQTIDTEFGID
jgi:hypothetical protein